MIIRSFVRPSSCRGTQTHTAFDLPNKSAINSSSSTLSSLPGSETLRPPSESSDSLSSNRSSEFFLEGSNYLFWNLLFVWLCAGMLLSKLDYFFSLLFIAFMYGLCLDKLPVEDTLFDIYWGFSSSSWVWITNGDFLFLFISISKSNTFWILLKLFVILFSIWTCATAGCPNLFAALLSAFYTLLMPTLMGCNTLLFCSIMSSYFRSSANLFLA